MRPGILSSAVLFRAMVPHVPEQSPSLDGITVLMLNGRADPLIPATEAERLASLLRAAGADVTLEWQPTGHDLTAADVARAREWLKDFYSE